MDVTLNGDRTALPPEAKTVAGLLEHLGLGGKPCAVEINGSIVPHGRHGEHAIGPGDRIEIVTLVGGG